MTTIRRAATGDAGPAVELLLRSRRAAVGAIPPAVHDDDELRAWFTHEVMARCEVLLAHDAAGVLCGLLVLDGDWVDQFYVEPLATGRGTGTLLLDAAIRRRPGGLRLWCFAANVKALRFYAARGFAEVERTDGSANEERAPDVLLERRPAAASHGWR